MTDWKNTSEVVALNAGTNITITDNGESIPIINAANLAFTPQIFIFKSEEGYSPIGFFSAEATYAKVTVIGKGGAGASGMFGVYGDGPAHIAGGGGGGGGGGVLIAYLHNIGGLQYSAQTVSNSDVWFRLGKTPSNSTIFKAIGGADGIAQRQAIVPPAAGGGFICVEGVDYPAENYTYYGFQGQDGGVNYGNINLPYSHETDADYFDNGGCGGNSAFGGGVFSIANSTVGINGIPYTGGGSAGGNVVIQGGVVYPGGTKTEGIVILEIY